MLQPGDRAPEFTLPDERGVDTSLTALLDGPLILYFYPADFTPGCTRQACRIRELHALILGSGLAVVGISPQSPDSHRRFRDRHDLPFRLLSDEDKTVIRMYGVDGPLGIGVRRASFFIEQDRTVKGVMLADFRIGRHEAFIRKAAEVAGG
jgi:peroxiredoxin Q/BCP